MDVSQYLEIFLDETNEHLQNLNTQILSLEQEPDNMDTINEIFRAAHSLKGMAGTMGYKRMQNLTHDMENVFSEVRNGNITVKASMIDVLFQCLDALEEYTTNIRENADEGTNDNEPLIKQLNDILNGQDDSDEESAADTVQEVSAVPAGNVGDRKWLEINLGDSEKHVLHEARNQGKNVYGLTVKVQESCILKAARAFLVFKAVEENGEIVLSNPSAQDIEDEKFDLDFSLVVVSDAELDKIIAAGKSVSEIEDVIGDVLDIDHASVAPQAAPKEEPAKTEPQPAEQTAPVVAPAAPAAKTPAKSKKKADEKKPAASKPVVNRTVRVDIEKLDTLMNLVSELIIAKNSLVSASAASGTSSTSVNEQIEYLESVTTSLHESVIESANGTYREYCEQVPAYGS